MEEKTVSPIIGVILMAAITVIVAFIIATFVFTMANQVTIEETPTMEELCKARCYNTLKLNYSRIEENCKPFCLCVCLNGTKECIYSIKGECINLE